LGIASEGIRRLKATTLSDLGDLVRHADMDTSKERSALVEQLATQRHHILGILEGLSEEQLRRRILPSGWHCLGLVKHLTVSDEHYWFRCVVGGEPWESIPDEDWQVAPHESAAEVFDGYRKAARRSDAVIAATDLDAPPARPDPAWKDWGRDFPDVRTVLLHVVTETAVHAGHLDAMREMIDTRQWIVQ
jgi:uncharacterized damage-inducible protein DinB